MRLGCGVHPLGDTIRLDDDGYGESGGRICSSGDDSNNAMDRCGIIKPDRAN